LICPQVADLECPVTRHILGFKAKGIAISLQRVDMRNLGSGVLYWRESYEKRILKYAGDIQRAMAGRTYRFFLAVFSHCHTIATLRYNIV